MRYVSFDTETHLIRQGLTAPQMVCLTFAEKDGTVAQHEASGVLADLFDDVSSSTKESRGTFVWGIMLRDAGVTWLRKHLTDDGVTIVGHNIGYDLGVAAACAPSLMLDIFTKYQKGLVHDTQIRQQLIDIAQGNLKFYIDEDTGEVTKSSYHLSDLSSRLLDKWLQKKDTWRLKYGLLDGVRLDQWPAEAVQYAVDDAVTTAEVHAAQEVVAGAPIPNSPEQHRAAWALHLMSAWGLRTDGVMVTRLHADLQKDFTERMEALRPSGLLTITPARALKTGPRKGELVPEKTSKKMSAIYDRVTASYAAKGVACPQTDKGRVATDKKTLKDSGDKDLMSLAEAGGIGKLLQTYVPILESGTRVPINPRYNVLVETGRTSCSRPNCQNPPRAGGVRECFVPRDGWVYAFCDYDTLELRSLAQVCLDILGRSEMAEALRRGEDLHLSLAAEMLGITLAEAQARFAAGDAEVKEYRQQAKPANFGFPGGMAADSFREYAEGYGIFLSTEQAQEIHETWLRKWPEMVDYFRYIKSITTDDRPMIQLRSGRMRGGAGYCATANGFFQGLAADGAKEALWLVARECYVDKTSALYGCRPVLFMHDEIGMEIPIARIGRKRAAAAAERLAAVMIEAMAKWIPDIPISCKPVMCRRWYKGAEQAKVDGVLVPSKPVKVEKDGKKRTTWEPDLEGLAA